MKKVLIDSSIWISYFKSKNAYTELDDLIRNNQICTNNLILSELTPFLHIKKQNEVIKLLLELPNIEVLVNWELIINLQIQNLKKGINKAGIPDLIILDNVMSNNLILYTEDNHFSLMKQHLSFDLFE